MRKLSRLLAVLVILTTLLVPNQAQAQTIDSSAVSPVPGTISPQSVGGAPTPPPIFQAPVQPPQAPSVVPQSVPTRSQQVDQPVSAPRSVQTPSTQAAAADNCPDTTTPPGARLTPTVVKSWCVDCDASDEFEQLKEANGTVNPDAVVFCTTHNGGRRFVLPNTDVGTDTQMKYFHCVTRQLVTVRGPADVNNVCSAEFRRDPAPPPAPKHCTPNPTVTKLVQKLDANRLVGHLFAKSNDSDLNRLITVKVVNDASSQIANVVATTTASDGSNRQNVTIQPGARGGTFTLTMPPNTRELHFTIVKGAGASSATVNFEVVDECYGSPGAPNPTPWKTFLGGGPAAFQP